MLETRSLELNGMSIEASTTEECEGTMSDYEESIHNELKNECPVCFVVVEARCDAEKRRKRSDHIQFNVVVNIEVRKPITTSGSQTSTEDEDSTEMFTLSTDNIQTIINSASDSLPNTVTETQLVVVSDTKRTVEETIAPEMIVFTTTPAITTTTTTTTTVEPSFDELSEQNDQLQKQMETLHTELSTLR